MKTNSEFMAGLEYALTLAERRKTKGKTVATDIQRAIRTGNLLREQRKKTPPKGE